MDAIKEDRAEIRFQEDKIYTLITSVTIASFAITAFIIGSSALSVSVFGRMLLPSMDVGLFLILCVVFWRLNKNLNSAQTYLQQREVFLETVVNTVADGPKPSQQFRPFTGLSSVPMKLVPHLGVRYIFGVAAGVLVIKFAVLVLHAAGWDGFE